VSEIQLGPPVLDDAPSISFSYPANIAMPHSISFAGVHAGLLIAYASSNLVIVLVEGKEIIAILRGHQFPICCVTFDVRAPHLASCDLKGYVIYWRFQDMSWSNSRVIELQRPVTCMVWFSAHREVFVSSDDGLVVSSIADFGSSGTRLCSKSSFCASSLDASHIASHHNGKLVWIFTLAASSERLVQVLRHPANVEAFDFHPSMAACLTITVNLVLRIWRQSLIGTFACTFSMNVPSVGRFVRPPAIFADYNSIGSAKPARIGFIDSADTFMSLKVDDNGRVSTSSPKSFSVLTSLRRVDLSALYRTNLGLEAIVIDSHSISVKSKHPRAFLFHQNSIVSAQFAPVGSWLFSLDLDGFLIRWPVFDPYHHAEIVSQDALFAAWTDDAVLVYSERNGAVRSFPGSDLGFPDVPGCRYLTCVKRELFALTSNEFVSKGARKKLPPYSLAAFSEVYQATKLALLAKEDGQILILSLPTFETTPCGRRNRRAIQIASVTFNSFAVLTPEGVEMFHHLPSGFALIHSVAMPRLRGICADGTNVARAVLAFDAGRIYALANGVVPILTMSGISCVSVHSCGHVGVVRDKTITIYPSFCVRSRIGDGLRIGKDECVNYMVSPFQYLSRSSQNKGIIQGTLFHLLEFSLLDRLGVCAALQVPAIPNQYPIPEAMLLSVNKPEFIQYATELKEVREDVDLFGMRYILAIRESAWPPSYFALWLSFSFTQSQVAEYLKGFINRNGLSKFYIAISIHMHSVLVDIVKAALARSWAETQLVEPVALLHVALGETTKLSRLYSTIHDEQRADFFARNFGLSRTKSRALKNAYSSLSHHNLDMAACLFLLAGDVKACVNVILHNLNDPCLAFLVLRLIRNSNYDCTEIQWFLTTVKWNDDLAPSIVARLRNKSDVAQTLRGKILETDVGVNVSAFGDRRLPLFQIYYYLTRSNDIVPELAMKLDFDGLAPLALYLRSFVDCPYKSIRPVGEQASQEEVAPKSTQVDAFDFGSAMIPSDDDDSDWSGEEPDSETEESVEMRPLNSFDQFARDSRISLAKFYDDPATVSEEGTLLAAHFGETRFDCLTRESRVFLSEHISNFLDYCCHLFFESAEPPLTPSQMFALCLLLYRLIGATNPVLSFSAFQQAAALEYCHSVFSTAFLVGFWTYSHQMLAQILSDQVDAVVFEPADIPAACAKFEVDVASPKYPDSIPELLSRYGGFDYVSSLERDRLLVVFLLFKRMDRIAAIFDSPGWKEILDRRRDSMFSTLQLYERLLGSDPAHKQPTDPAARDWISIIVDDEHNLLIDERRQRLPEFPASAIFKGSVMSLANPEVVPLPHENLKSLALAPLDRQSIVVLADNKLISVSLGSGRVTCKEIGKRLEHEVISVKVHPRYDLFLAVSTNGPMLFDLKKGFLDYQFVLSSKEKVNCAAFSAKNLKLAVCSNVIDVFTLALAKPECEPSVTREINQPITAVAWVNGDTLLAVAYAQDNHGCLVIVDTLAKHHLPVEVKREWGLVTGIDVEPRCGKLVFVTQKGFTVVCDTKKNYRHDYVHVHGSPVAAISSLSGVFVFATENGTLITLSASDNENRLERIPNPTRIRAVAVVNDMMAAVGDGRLIIWRMRGRNH
jgi:hypothetical protein